MSGSMTPGEAQPSTAAIAYSIVVPLFDCRDAGMRPLESALDQAFARHRYEVVVVADARSRGAWPDALFARCDAVVAVDADFSAVDAEIALFDAGSRAARGEYLYFIEGHTVLAPDALRAIDARVSRDPGFAIGFGRRVNHARTRLGALIGANNDAHEARARQRGHFTLGANCVIRRSVFTALGGFEPRFQRFNETVLYERAIAAGLPIAPIDAALCTHHNDAGLRWLARLLVATGRAKARYYGSQRLAGVVPRTRHPVYRWVGAPAAAALAALPLRVAGPALIVAATALVRRAPALAANLYRIGVGFTDVSGYCFERAWGDGTARSCETGAVRDVARSRDVSHAASAALPGGLERAG
jgi:hypothetical protein